MNFDDQIQLILGKSEEVIPTLDDRAIDLVVTSPPYNIDLGNNKFNDYPYDLYNDNKEHSEYILWLKDIFQKIYPKMKSGGRVCINIGDPKNGSVPTHADIIHFMTHGLNYIPMANIIWEKSQVANRFSWGSFASPACPSFPQSFEYIMVFAKETKRLQAEGKTNINPENFKKWAFSLWKIAPENEMKAMGHPAMFPIEIPSRLIQMLSWEGALVLDPFNGAGTTAVACKELSRRYIGIEISQQYIDISWKRIREGTVPPFEKDMF